MQYILYHLFYILPAGQMISDKLGDSSIDNNENKNFRIGDIFVIKMINMIGA